MCYFIIILTDLNEVLHVLIIIKKNNNNIYLRINDTSKRTKQYMRSGNKAWIGEDKLNVNCSPVHCEVLF